MEPAAEQHEADETSSEQHEADETSAEQHEADGSSAEQHEADESSDDVDWYSTIAILAFVVGAALSILGLQSLAEWAGPTVQTSGQVADKQIKTRINSSSQTRTENTYRVIFSDEVGRATISVSKSKWGDIRQGSSVNLTRSQLTGRVIEADGRGWSWSNQSSGTWWLLVGLVSLGYGTAILVLPTSHKPDPVMTKVAIGVALLICTAVLAGNGYRIWRDRSGIADLRSDEFATATTEPQGEPGKTATTSATAASSTTTSPSGKSEDLPAADPGTEQANAPVEGLTVCEYASLQLVEIVLIESSAPDKGVLDEEALLEVAEPVSQVVVSAAMNGCSKTTELMCSVPLALLEHDIQTTAPFFDECT